MKIEEAKNILGYLLLDCHIRGEWTDDEYDEAIRTLIAAIPDIKEPPASLDEAANNYGVDIRLGYPRVMDETDKYIYNAFKAGAEWQYQKDRGEFAKLKAKEWQEGYEKGAEWMAGQGVSMSITDETEWADVDSFVHKNVSGNVILQIRKKR